MNLAKIYRGQSLPITFTLTDDDGNPLVINDLDDIWVNIFHKYSRISMETYQLTDTDITVVSSPNGQIKVILNDDDTDDCQTGIYTADIKTSETDADYAANTRYRSSRTDVFILVDSEV